MSPEQIRGDADLDARTDIWSLGVVLHQLLTGDFPFHAQNTAELREQILNGQPTLLSSAKGTVPRRLAKVCLKCLAKNPAARYRDAKALADDLHTRPTLHLHWLLLLVAMVMLPALFLLTWQRPVSAFNPSDLDIPQDKLAPEKRLFNGENLDGWVFHSIGERNRVKDCVRVADNRLICSAKRQYYLRTEDRFRNFLLKLEYRFPANGKSRGMGSAVLLRMIKADGHDLEYLRVKLGDWTTGIVVAANAQLPNLPDSDKLYPDLRAVVKEIERPGSEWNSLEVLCNGGAASVNLNGREVNRETAGEEQEGYIGLAPQGCNIEFRNLTLRAIRP